MAAPNADPGAGQPDDLPEPHDDAPDPAGHDDAPADDPPADAAHAAAEGDDDLDVEGRWAGIVAELSDLSGLDAADRPRPGTGPATDAGTGPAPSAGGPGRSAGDALGSFPVAPWVRPTGPRDWPTTPDVEDLEEAESHFVPPDPPLVLGRDPLLTMAWAVVAGVPLVLLVLLVVARPYPVVVAQVGIGVFLAGLAVLLWRMPHRRDDDRGPGAVV
ncbi:hypothetical protein IF650_18845 [Cellulosimicrobium terreum]|nr:hypothetical protein [Cellulosimicrobium terreum]